MNIGIIGAGGIAVSMAETVNGMDDANLYAIAARSPERAKAFAEKYGCEKAYGSYEEMVSDEQVDIVYIATPHSHHFAHAKLAIEPGKHVLCEKAFTVNARQAEELFALAKQKGVLITEAIWTRYMPSRALINQELESGIIGKVHTLTANLSYRIFEVERLIRPELAGGALLDVGVYPLNFALMHFGSDVKRIEASTILTDTGVDGQDAIMVEWSDGRMANLTAGIYGLSDRKGIFYGEKGYMIVENINNPECIDIFDSNRNLIRHVEVPKQITGYEYEVREMMECIRAGKTECPSMPHEDTLRVLRITDGIREKWGLTYPCD